MDNNYLDYLNKSQQEIVKDYNLITNDNIINIKNGDSIKLIKRNNLQFKQGGVALKIIDSSILIRNLGYRYNYVVSLENYIILHKANKKVSKNRKFYEYLLNGLDNNSIKITKKSN